jgi:HTH-type transcriptional regulator / antitoxin HipB
MRKIEPKRAPLVAQFTSPADLGQYLRDVRIEAGLTHRQAAGLCNVGPRFLLELENGKTTASLGKIFQVLRGYGIRLHAERLARHHTA